MIKLEHLPAEEPRAVPSKSEAADKHRDGMEGRLGKNGAKWEITTRNNKNCISFNSLDVDNLPYYKCLSNRTFLNATVMPVVGSLRPNSLKKRLFWGTWVTQSAQCLIQFQCTSRSHSFLSSSLALGSA